MATYKNAKQQKAHAAAQQKYAVELNAANDASDRAASGKAHTDYEAACAELGVDPNAEYED